MPAIWNVDVIVIINSLFLYDGLTLIQNINLFYNVNNNLILSGETFL